MLTASRELALVQRGQDGGETLHPGVDVGVSGRLKRCLFAVATSVYRRQTGFGVNDRRERLAVAPGACWPYPLIEV